MFKLTVSLLVLALSSSSVLGLAVRQVDLSDSLSASSSALSSTSAVTLTSTIPGDDATVTVTGTPTTVSDSPTSTIDATPVPSSTAAPSGCTKTYTIVEGDTCWGISASQQVPSSALAQLNAASINSECTNLQVGQQLCLEDATSACSTPYTVVDGDYCEKVADANSISLEEFYALNVDIDSVGCSNLFTGSTVCVGSGNSTTPVPTDTVITSALPSTSDFPSPTLTSLPSSSVIGSTSGILSSTITNAPSSSSVPSSTLSSQDPGATTV
ncbi:hypothetical protein CPB83DRAFT_849841 [Crepidotus variabilis]|uniref:LysM domain-containing protein n=1 Tax=Crepidotus variabilis TaxID=179855 RepID=A0A9P6ELQ8_9AGAR|nr:hypothetical protein CPB83DRAFT_849841 [Crepidotus variabilis]